MNPSAAGSRTANDSTSVHSCEASVRPGEKGTFTSCPALFAASSTAAQPPRTIRSASETFFFPDCELKSFWIPSSACRAFASAAGWFTSQSFCGARRMRAPFAPPRLSEPRNVAADAQAVVTSWEIDSPDARILPQQGLRGNERAKVPRKRSHVTVRELIPRLGERVCELLRILEEALRDRRIDRVHPQGEIRREHDRGVPLRRIVGIRNGARCRPVLGSPLVLSGGAFHQLPLIAE